MTSATIFVEGVFRDGYEQHFAEYSRQVKAYLNQYDAKVVRRQRITKTLYGVNTLSLIMLIDFASREVAEPGEI